MGWPPRHLNGRLFLPRRSQYHSIRYKEIIFDRPERETKFRTPKRFYWRDRMSKWEGKVSINKTLFFGALLVCTGFGADQASKAQYDVDEQRICNNPNAHYSFTANVD